MLTAHVPAPLSEAHIAAARLIAALIAPCEPARPIPRTIVVVAHPDDETVGLGSRLPRLNQARFVHVTDGAPRDGRDAAANGLGTPSEYIRVRRDELESALALCGICPEQAVCLNCPDQQACAQMANLTVELTDLLVRFDAEVVLTHPYEGGHPDHDATALAVHAAAALIRRRPDRSPAIVEMTSYHNGPAGICPCEFLPRDNGNRRDPATVVLTDDERRFKQRLFDCFATQQGTLQYFPIAIERFRQAPLYDFTAPPHEGQLFYEGFDWGMTGPSFCELAAVALARLGLEGCL